MSSVSHWVYDSRGRDTETISLPLLFGLGDLCSVPPTAFDPSDMVPGSGSGNGSGCGVGMGMGMGMAMNQKSSSKPHYHQPQPQQQRQQTQNTHMHMHMQQWSSWELEMRRDMHGEEEQEVPHVHPQKQPQQQPQQQQEEYERQNEQSMHMLYTQESLMGKRYSQQQQQQPKMIQPTVHMHNDQYGNNNSVLALGTNTANNANNADENTATFELCDESIVPDIFAAIPEFNVPVFKEEESKAISEVSKRMGSAVENGAVKEEAQPFQASPSAYAYVYANSSAKPPRPTQSQSQSPSPSPSTALEQATDNRKQAYNIYKRRRAVAMQRLAEKRKRFQLNRANASTVRYNVRKRIADRRPRVNGRFVSTVSGTGSGSGSEAENDVIYDDVLFWAE